MPTAHFYGTKTDTNVERLIGYSIARSLESVLTCSTKFSGSKVAKLITVVGNPLNRPSDSNSWAKIYKRYQF